LRNAVSDFARTKYVFPVDIDFLPSKGLYKILLGLMDSTLEKMDRAAVIVPHWEPRTCAISNNVVRWTSQYPLDFNTLNSYMNRGLVRPFHADLQFFGWQNEFWRSTKDKGCFVPAYTKYQKGKINSNPKGVRISGYELWSTHSKTFDPSIPPSRRSLLPVADSNLHAAVVADHWEPFFMVSRLHNGGMLARYNEIFTGRILNKVQWVTVLRAQKYSFFTLKRHFLIHRDHPPSDFAAVLDTSLPSFKSWMHLAMMENIKYTLSNQGESLSNLDLIFPNDVDDEDEIDSEENIEEEEILIANSTNASIVKEETNVPILDPTTFWEVYGISHNWVMVLFVCLWFTVVILALSNRSCGLHMFCRLNEVRIACFHFLRDKKQ